MSDSNASVTNASVTNASDTNPNVKAIVLFDGLCNLCDQSVQWLIRHDHAQAFRYGSLQSEHGQHLRRAYGIPESVDSIVVIQDGHARTYSNAALALGELLGGRYAALAYLARLVPRPARDVAYRFVAAHRYRWFGKKDSCMVPTPATKALFLADSQTSDQATEQRSDP